MAVGRVSFTKAERERLAEVLWLLNWVSVVTGAILFSLGVFLKVELLRWQEVMSEVTVVMLLPHTLIATGISACCINYLGAKICLDCTDTNRFLRWKLVLMPYVVCSFCFTACVLMGALLCLGLHSQLEESLLIGLKDAMWSYKDTDVPGRCSVKRTVDALQLQFQCCGNHGYTDWFTVQWINRRYLNMTDSAVQDRLRSNVDGRYLMDAVPFSCCSALSAGPCVQQHLANLWSRPHPDTARGQLEYLSSGALSGLSGGLRGEVTLWRKGCRQALMEHYTGTMQSIGLTTLIIWLFELLVLTGVRYLQTAMENVLRLGDPASQSDGWLLENSFAHTARSNFNIIKSLGKCYQGDEEDPNINVPTNANEEELPSSLTRGQSE